jgi:hypothetical protein
VPRDEFLTSADLSSPNVDEARFLAHQRPVSRSELIELGADPDVVAELDSYDNVTNNIGTSARARKPSDRSLLSAHESTELVMVVEAYYRIDYDGDGIAELRRIISAGGANGTEQLLLHDSINEHPFAVGVGYLSSYTWDGVSLFDRLKMVQDIKTELLRDSLDMTKRSTRQRLGLIEGDADPNDVMTSQRGGFIRMRTPQGIVPVPDVQLSPVVFQMLEMMDGMRKDRGGGAVDATASAQVLGQGGDWSLERLMAAVEQLNAMVAKNLTETLVKPIFRKLHRLLREHYNQSINLASPTGWQQSQPSQWPLREDMTISMGMSVGERSQRMGALQSVMQMHASDQQNGKVGILSSDIEVYRARVDFARLAGLPNPEQYYINPQSPEAQQAMQGMAQQAQQAQQAQMEQQQQMMRFQYSLMTDVEKVKGEFAIAKQQLADQAKAQLEQQKTLIEEMRAQLDAMTKVMGHRVKLAEIEGNLDAEEAKQEIDLLQGERKAAVELAKVRQVK